MEQKFYTGAPWYVPACLSSIAILFFFHFHFRHWAIFCIAIWENRTLPEEFFFLELDTRELETGSKQIFQEEKAKGRNPSLQEGGGWGGGSIGCGEGGLGSRGHTTQIEKSISFSCHWWGTVIFMTGDDECDHSLSTRSFWLIHHGAAIWPPCGLLWNRLEITQAIT